MQDLLDRLTERLKELEEWTRKDEDRIYDRIKELADQESDLLKRFKDIEDHTSRIYDLESISASMEKRLSLLLKQVTYLEKRMSEMEHRCIVGKE